MRYVVVELGKDPLYAVVSTAIEKEPTEAPLTSHVPLIPVQPPVAPEIVTD
jgi:hypothetical protein